jgi:hypothetical protein
MTLTGNYMYRPLWLTGNYMYRPLWLTGNYMYRPLWHWQTACCPQNLLVFHMIHSINCACSSVSTVSSLRAGRFRVRTPAEERRPFLALAPTSSPIQWAARVKLPERKAEHSILSSSDIKNKCCCTAAPPYALMACTRTALFDFTLPWDCNSVE